MHRVQALILLTLPFRTARTVCKLTFQRRLDLLLAWLMLLPVAGPFPQISQTLDISGAPLKRPEYKFFRTAWIYENFAGYHARPETNFKNQPVS